MEIEILKRASAFGPPGSWILLKGGSNFITERCSELPAVVCCRAMTGSPSTFCAWRYRQANPTARMINDTDFGGLIVKVHDASFGTYQWRRVTTELRIGLGREVNHERCSG